jgi:hypothetical protein
LPAFWENFVAAYRKPSITLKTVSKATYDMQTAENRTRREEESWNRNSDAAFGKILEIVSVS